MVPTPTITAKAVAKPVPEESSRLNDWAPAFGWAAVIFILSERSVAFGDFTIDVVGSVSGALIASKRV